MVRFALAVLCCTVGISFANVRTEQLENTAILSGIVVDSITREALPGCVIQIDGTTISTVSNGKGEFKLPYKKEYSSLTFSLLGYKMQKISIPKNPSNPLLIKLHPQAQQVKEIVVNRKKKKYDKDNPAVELIEKVIANKKVNQPSSQAFYQCEHYEKVIISIESLNKDFAKKVFGKQSSKVNSFLDTCDVTGKTILTCSVQEKIEDIYFRKEPESLVRVVHGKNSIEIDDFIDDATISPILSNVFAEVNLFDNDINLLQSRFPSPLSSTIATSFYKYYIKDTVSIDGKECTELLFAPFNPNSFSFTGYLYITNDSTYSLVKSKIYIPKVANVNYVKKYTLTQSFGQSVEGIYYIKQNDATIQLGLPGFKTDLQVRKINFYKDYIFNQPSQDIFTKPYNLHTAEEHYQKDDLFWQEKRHTPLKKSENTIDALVDVLLEIPWIKITAEVGNFLMSGYIETNKEKKKSFFDIGPITSLFSYNSVEGIRVRIGGMTTANLHPHFFISGYGAYGFRDKQWKYNGEITYSFNSRKYFKDEFPIHALSLMYEYDTRQQGEELLFTNKDNIFTSFKISNQNYMTYDRRTQVTWHIEEPHGFSLKLWFNHLIQKPAGLLKFEKKDIDGQIVSLQNLTFNEVGVVLHYSHKAQFAQTKRNRYLLNKGAPIFILSHRTGFKKFLNADYSYHKTDLSFQKRFYLSAFGYLHNIIKVGKVWTSVPFTMLGTPNINNSIIIQPECYNLLNAMEFLNDEHIQLQLEYHLNGFIFNRIPYFNMLMFREVIGVKGYWGRLTHKNNPDINSNLLLFPRNQEGKSIVNKLTLPYWEMNVGIENILTIGRIDYVWRVNYRNAPKAIQHGVRFMLYFRF